MGIDHGSVRTGLSLSDPLGMTAQPLAVLEPGTGKGALAEIARLARTHEVTRFVIGLPLNMDGREGERARGVRAFGRKLAGLTNLPVEYWDERLSSVEAERVLLEADLSRKRRKAAIDKTAAQIILGSYLDAKAYDRSGT